MNLFRRMLLASLLTFLLGSPNLVEAISIEDWGAAKLHGLTQNEVHKILGKPDLPDEMDGYSFADSPDFIMGSVAYKDDQVHAVMLVSKPSITYKKIRDLQLQSDEVKFVSEDEGGIVFAFRNPGPKGPKFLCISPPDGEEAGPMIVESMDNPLEAVEEKAPGQLDFNGQLKLAEQGNADAQLAVGMMYFDGAGVPEDNSEAAKWFQKAADQENATGQCKIGYMYQRGLGVAKEYKEAMKWALKAAAQGNAESMYRIGSLYLGGHGVPQDIQEATKWFRKSAELGYANAQATMGHSCRNDVVCSPNFPEALQWFLKAAEGGDIDCLRYAGEMYRDGEGTPKDVVLAHKCFSLAGVGNKEAVSQRKNLEKMMTPDQIEKSRVLIREWKERHDFNW